MNRESCETIILQKLKEIKAIAKEYDKSGTSNLSIIIKDDSNDYMSVYSSNKEFPIHAASIEGKVYHFGN
jgi:hypothetical protein